MPRINHEGVVYDEDPIDPIDDKCHIYSNLSDAAYAFAKGKDNTQFYWDHDLKRGGIVCVLEGIKDLDEFTEIARAGNKCKLEDSLLIALQTSVSQMKR